MTRTHRSSVVMAALASTALAFACAPETAAAGHKSLFTSTPSTSGVDPKVLRCETLNKGVAQHIRVLRALAARIDKERQVPSNLESMFEQWSGSSRPIKPDPETQAQLTRERRTTEEIAAMLPAYKCAPIDIDAELAKQPEPQKPEETASPKPHKRKIF